jgi:hypothetical protein
LPKDKEEIYARAICSLIGEIPECIYWSAYKSRDAFQEIWADRCYWKYQAQRYKQLYLKRKGKKSCKDSKVLKLF